jgi:hypothetical protein
MNQKKAPSSNLQAPGNIQLDQTPIDWKLAVGASLELGAWSLEL